MLFNDVMVNAINKKSMVKLTFNSIEKGRIVRTCIPFDIGPGRRIKDGIERFHFYNLDSPEGSHTLSILPEQILNLEIMNAVFEPGDYVKWEPKWFLQRDWGKYS